MHESRAKPASRRLIGVRGVKEAVAHDHGPAHEGRLDDLAHELCARRLVEEQLALIGHLGIGGVEQDGPDLLGDGRAARLAQRHHLAPRGLEGGNEPRHLRGLTGTVHALKRDERTAPACRLPHTHAYLNPPQTVRTYRSMVHG